MTKPMTVGPNIKFKPWNMEEHQLQTATETSELVRYSGKFMVAPELTRNQITYLRAFSASRRCAFNSKFAKGDKLRIGAGMPVGGPDCEFHVAEGPTPEGPVVKDYDRPPQSQPGLWCDWHPCECGCAIIWNGREDAENAVDWLEFIVDNFLEPWKCKISGGVTWQGSQKHDRGKIIATENNIEVFILDKDDNLHLAEKE